MARARFPKGSSKVGKASAGRTALQNTPVTIRSDQKLGEAFERNIRTQLASRVGHAARVIGRITVRFEDVNGPKGGIDSVCTIKATMPGQPSIVVEKQAASPAVAFGRAVSAVGTAVERARGKRGLSSARPRAVTRAAAPKAAATRTARSRATTAKATTAKATTTKATTAKATTAKATTTKAAPRKAAAARPARATKGTAKSGVSASARGAGGTSKARRTTLGRTTRATAAPEDSKTKPSRKSTRGSANRATPSQTKGRAVATKLQRPAARTKRKT